MENTLEKKSKSLLFYTTGEGFTRLVRNFIQEAFEKTYNCFLNAI